MSDGVIKMVDGAPVASAKRKAVEYLAGEMTEQAAAIADRYPNEEIMRVIINNIQALVGSFINFPIPGAVIKMLNSKPLSPEQMDILQSIAVKTIAYQGSKKA